MNQHYLRLSTNQQITIHLHFLQLLHNWFITNLHGYSIHLCIIQLFYKFSHHVLFDLSPFLMVNQFISVLIHFSTYLTITSHICMVRNVVHRVQDLHIYDIFLTPWLIKQPDRDSDADLKDPPEQPNHDSIAGLKHPPEVLTQVEGPGSVQQDNHDCVLGLLSAVQALMVSNEYVLLLYVMDFLLPHACY